MTSCIGNLNLEKTLLYSEGIPKFANFGLYQNGVLNDLLTLLPLTISVVQLDYIVAKILQQLPDRASVEAWVLEVPIYEMLLTKSNGLNQSWTTKFLSGLAVLRGSHYFECFFFY